MGAARKDVDDITPEALEERGNRLIAEGNRLVVQAQIRRVLAAHDWVDQDNSPLGKRRHLELARSGEVSSRKVRRQVLIRRAELDAYIEKKGLARGKREEEEGVDDIIERVMRTGEK